MSQTTKNALILAAFILIVAPTVYLFARSAEKDRKEQEVKREQHKEDILKAIAERGEAGVSDVRDDIRDRDGKACGYKYTRRLLTELVQEGRLKSRQTRRDGSEPRWYDGSGQLVTRYSLDE